MKRTPLNKISKKRKAQLPEYNALIKRLRELCGNVSELSGDKPDWKSQGRVEPHHIEGRIGQLFTDPFNIILVTGDEHSAIEEERSDYSKEYLLWKIKCVRVKQGY